jgi:hypothetical protein
VVIGSSGPDRRRRRQREHNPLTRIRRCSSWQPSRAGGFRTPRGPSTVTRSVSSSTPVPLVPQWFHAAETSAMEAPSADCQRSVVVSAAARSRARCRSDPAVMLRAWPLENAMALLVAPPGSCERCGCNLSRHRSLLESRCAPCQLADPAAGPANHAAVGTAPRIVLRVLEAGPLAARDIAAQTASPCRPSRPCYSGYARKASSPRASRTSGRFTGYAGGTTKSHRDDAHPLLSLGATPVNYLGNPRCGPCGLLFRLGPTGSNAGPAAPQVGEWGAPAPYPGRCDVASRRGAHKMRTPHRPSGGMSGYGASAATAQPCAPSTPSYPPVTEWEQLDKLGVTGSSPVPPIGRDPAPRAGSRGYGARTVESRVGRLGHFWVI